MKLLAFPSIRANDTRAVECAEQATSLTASAEAIREALCDETFVKDGACYYLYEAAREEEPPTTALLGIMRLEDGSECEQALDEAGRAAACVIEQRTLDAHVQLSPALLTYPENPVLTAILVAAKQGAALYDIYDPSGCRHKVWKISRGPATEAIATMVEQLSEDEITADAVTLAAYSRVRDRLQTQAKQNDSYTGREPFHFAFAALMPRRESAVSTPHLPEGLIMHQIAAL